MCRFLALPLLALLLNASAFAEKADREKPMNIVADHCLAEQKTQQTVCTGNVVVTQGTMVMRADKVTMRQDAEGKQFAKGDGRPVRFKQKLDSGEMLDAESLSFDYDEVKGEMVLIVEGFKAQEEALPAAALRTLALLQAELPLKKAAALAAEIHGVKKNALYKYALEQQGE